MAYRNTCTTYQHDYDSQRRSPPPAYGAVNEQQERRHNDISLNMQKIVTAEQLRNLRYYFNGVPLTTTDQDKIRTFADLWEVLASHTTIRPGDYSQLKTALKTIGALSCLETLKKLEQAGSAHRLGNSRPSNHAVPDDRKCFDKMQREREESREGHIAALKDAQEVIRQERYRRERAERELADQLERMELARRQPREIATQTDRGDSGGITVIVKQGR